MTTHHKINHSVQCSCFSSGKGSDEYFLFVNQKPGSSFTTELRSAYAGYCRALKTFGLSDKTVVFSRIHLSDIQNQKTALEKSPLFKMLSKGALSCIQQMPLQGGRIGLLSYHIKPNGHGIDKEMLYHDNLEGRNGVVLTGRNYKMLWTANYAGHSPLTSEKQTEEIFNSAISQLQENGMTLLDSGIRTWVYVRDIDNQYQSMVKARRKFFKRKGLTEKTRYLASTGIEAKFWDAHSLVSLDCLAMGGLQPEQIVCMEALQNLSPTIKYGVTFERGIKVVFGDRIKLYISGTASINKKGGTIHLGDVAKQTRRTLDNIKALLAPHKAGFKDLAYLVIYLRDPKDEPEVSNVINKVIPQKIPRLMIEASVCRPGWLVEIEAIAIKRENNDFPDFF